MSEKIPSPPKKMVSRSVAVALGIICIILVVALGVVAFYMSTHSHTDSDYNSLSTQNTNLNNIVELANSTVWVNNQTVNQPAGSYSSWNFSASYAGYVSVWVPDSSVAGNSVKVIYSNYGVNFNQELVVVSGNTTATRQLAGTSTAFFPILPSSNIQIEVGNDEIGHGATETVTITYYY